jgi:hypothetical protein
MKIEPHDGILYMRCGEKNQRAFRLYVHVSVCVCVIPMALIKPVVSEHVKCCRAAITGRNKYAVCVRAEHLLCVFFRPHPPKLRATYIYALVKDSQRDKKVLLLFQNVLYFSLFPYRVSLILIKFSPAMFFFVFFSLY